MQKLHALVAMATVAIACNFGSGSDSGSDDGPGPWWACTEIGCDDQLTANASAPLGSIYSVEVVLDGETASIACNIPADAEGAGGVVSGSSTLYADCWPNGVVLLGAPDEATIRFLDEDGSLLGEAALTPDYDSVQPNGEGCEPICMQADVVVQTVAAANPNPNT